MPQPQSIYGENKMIKLMAHLVLGSMFDGQKVVHVGDIKSAPTEVHASWEKNNLGYENLMEANTQMVVLEDLDPPTVTDTYDGKSTTFVLRYTWVPISAPQSKYLDN